MHASTLCDEGVALDAPAVVAATAVAPPTGSDEWSSRQRVRELDRKLRRSMFSGTAAAGRTPHSPRRFDPPQNLFDQLEHATMPAISASATAPTPADRLQSQRAESSQGLAWLVVFVGTMASAAGISLIAWSLSAHQLIYWNAGLGLALGGQAALILGLVLVVSRLWRHSRFASGKLQEVHARLAQLQHTADALTAMRSGGAPAFYADLARGASPQMLLTNLKGQLDQLATRLGSRI